MPGILLIEDEAALTRVIAWALIEEGFEVAAVADVDAALAKVTSWKPDVVVFDTVIDPSDKGPALARIKQLSSQTRVIDVSGEKNARASGIIAAHDNGAGPDAHLGLPVPTDQLIAVIRKLLAESGVRALGAK